MELSILEMLGVLGGIFRLCEVACEQAAFILKGGKNGKCKNNPKTNRHYIPS